MVYSRYRMAFWGLLLKNQTLEPWKGNGAFYSIKKSPGITLITTYCIYPFHFFSFRTSLCCSFLSLLLFLFLPLPPSPATPSPPPPSSISPLPPLPLSPPRVLGSHLLCSVLLSLGGGDGLTLWWRRAGLLLWFWLCFGLPNGLSLFSPEHRLKAG